MPRARCALLVCLIAGALLLLTEYARHANPIAAPRFDPAAWGSDHVGQAVPAFTTGDECLFCHREKIGATWSTNRHTVTIRPAADAPALAALRQSDAKNFANSVQFILGGSQRQRFLRPAKDYGKLELLFVAWQPPRANQPARLVGDRSPPWDATRFADACAGCHTTAVDPTERAFAALAVDCFACHGMVPAEHARQPTLAYLSPGRSDDARVVTSICAQCHVRTGTSRATGRPYPTNFVAGDNLFRDFRADYSDAALRDVSPADRHVLENVRAVVERGREDVTCLSCHDVHAQSSRKHRHLPDGDLCLTCHRADGPKAERKPYASFSKTCGY